MFRKEYFFIFIIIGLSIAYAFLLFLVFLSRGRLFRLIKKKIAIGTMIITFSSMLAAWQVSCIPPGIFKLKNTIPSTPSPVPTGTLSPSCYVPSPPPEPTISPVPSIDPTPGSPQE